VSTSRDLNLKIDIKIESISSSANEGSTNLTSTNDDGAFSSDDDMPLLEKYRQQKQKTISANANTTVEKKSTPIEWKPMVDPASSSNTQQHHSNKFTADSKNKATTKGEDSDASKLRNSSVRDKVQTSSTKIQKKRKVIESSSSSPLSAETSAPSSPDGSVQSQSSLSSRDEEKNTIEKDQVKREPSLQTSRESSPNKAAKIQTPIKKESKQNEQECSSSGRTSVKSSPTTPIVKNMPATRRSVSKQQTPTETPNPSKTLKSQESEDSELIFAPQIKYDSTNDDQRNVSGASSEVESKLDKRTGEYSRAADETSKRVHESITESGEDSELRKRNNKRKRVRSKAYDDEEISTVDRQTDDSNRLSTTKNAANAQINKNRTNKKDEFDFDADVNENKKPIKIRKIERSSSIKLHQESKEEQNIDESNENTSVINEIDESSVKDEEEGSSETPEDVKSRISSLRNAGSNTRLRSKNSQPNYNQQPQSKKRLGSSSSLSQLAKKNTQQGIDVSPQTKTKIGDSGLVSIIKSEPVQISATSIVSGSDYEQEVKSEDVTAMTDNSSMPALTRDNLTKLMSSNTTHSGGVSSSVQQELMQSYSISSTSSTISCNSTNSSLIIPNKFEDEKTYKAWKKSIMMVLNNICSHKYILVFFCYICFI
jgi:hypothetical protein